MSRGAARSALDNLLRKSALAVLFVSLASPAGAQIYSWRDEKGTLVLSDRPQGEGGRPTPVASFGTSTARDDRLAQQVPTDPISRYSDLISEHARLNRIRPELVRAVIHVESAFNPTAVSPKGAMGLMQLMPGTAATFGVGNPFNPAENVRAGTAYLRQLLDRYGDDEELALAAYNAGPGAVDRYGQTVPPYRETQSYVLKVNEAAQPAIRISGTRIYKSVEIIDGREVVKYSDKPQ
jgi:hypothetical protein